LLPKEKTPKFGRQPAKIKFPTPTHRLSHFPLIISRACLPLAEAINQAQSKLRAGTFKIFERDGASLREIDVHVGFGKIEALLLGGSVCLTAVTLLLETLGNNSLGRRQTTNFTDEQFLTMLGVINLPFDLLLHENGLQVVSTRLFAPNVDASNPAMLAMGCCFSSLLRRFNASFDLSFKLLDVYARWHDIHADEDATASDISRGLPRPLCLTADAITSALIQHTVNFDMALKHPGLCHIAEDAIARQTNTIFALEKGQAKLDIALKFWEAQLKRDLFTTTFFRFIKEWKCSKFAQNSYRIELKIPFFVFALIREINEVDDVEVHRRTLTSLSSRDDLKPLVNAALEMLEYSKDSSRDEGERVGMCTAAALLLAFRVWILAHERSLLPDGSSPIYTCPMTTKNLKNDAAICLHLSPKSPFLKRARLC
jgi:hypothetical protein